MAVDWEPEERAAIERGIVQHPVTSNRCAALARIVYRIAQPRDGQTRGIQIHPKTPARWILPKRPLPRLWGTHTLIETQEHRVDALTGADGCASERYLEEHYRYPQALAAHDVDVFSVDPWIEEEP